MTPALHRRIQTEGRLACVVALLSFVSVAQCGDAGIAYQPAPTEGSGVVVVQAPFAGQYVCSSTTRADGRRPQRFVVGKAIREDYTLFSAEEEQALWNTRQDRLDEAERARESRARAARLSELRRNAKNLNAQAMTWPKVIVNDPSTCVPQLAYADAADWQQHLVCWNGGAHRVE